MCSDGICLRSRILPRSLPSLPVPQVLKLWSRAVWVQILALLFTHSEILGNSLPGLIPHVQNGNIHGIILFIIGLLGA